MQCFRKIPVARKIMDKRGAITIFRREILSYSAKLFRRIPFSAVFQQTFGSDKDYGLEGG